MGDELIYLRQGHELYVEAVLRDEVYKIDAQRGLPWHKRPNLRVGDLLPRPVASKSLACNEGRTVGTREASIVFPVPGGPTINKLWAPAAAIVKARLAIS